MAMLRHIVAGHPHSGLRKCGVSGGDRRHQGGGAGQGDGISSPPAPWAAWGRFRLGPPAFQLGDAICDGDLGPPTGWRPGGSQELGFRTDLPK